MNIDIDYYCEQLKVRSKETDEVLKLMFQLEGKNIRIRREFLLYNLEQEFMDGEDDEYRFDHTSKH